MNVNSIDANLLDAGDWLVLLLVKPNDFKVHAPIIYSNLQLREHSEKD